MLKLHKMQNVDRNIKTQTVGSIVDVINVQRNEALKNALDEVQKVKDILKDNANILGSEKTKHGEIAEFIEVHIRNAKELIQKRNPVASFGDLSRIDKTDYFINEIGVQSKFINGCNNNLQHILEHLKKYPDFCNDNSYYIIPKDHLEKIMDIYKGNNNTEFSDRSIKAIVEKIKEIEKETGKSFNEIVKPSISKYSEVQQNTAEKTVDKHEKEIIEQGQASLGEALKVGAISAGISGGMSLAFGIYQKHKQGKTLSNYTLVDWKELGIDFSKSAIEGGISGMSVYGITNFTDMPAPLASSFVSCTIGIASLANSYRKGEIDFDDFIEQSNVVSLDASITGLAATIGQAVIPIPLIGALIGTFAMKYSLKIGKEYLGKISKELEERLEKEYAKQMQKIHENQSFEVSEIINKYDKIGILADLAFDFDKNSFFRFQASVKLAEQSGVENKKIIRNDDDLDKFILS